LVLRAFAVCLVLVAGGCGGSGGKSTASSRCEDVPQALTNAIATGLNGRGSLRDAQAVESHDFVANVWFISAVVDPSGKVGTWAKVGALAADDESEILSVDSVAQDSSDWGVGGVTDAQLSMEDDGAKQSDACVHQE
jgi:hypothetical protein